MATGAVAMVMAVVVTVAAVLMVMTAALKVSQMVEEAQEVMAVVGRVEEG